MRLKHLDGIRGLASIIIVFSHIVQLYIQFLVSGNGNSIHLNIEKFFLNFPLPLIYSGNSMVFIFMTIGGFVISLSCLRYENINSLEKIFYRYLRLVISIFITTLLVYIIFKFGGFTYNKLDNYTYNESINIIKDKISFLETIKYSFFDVFVDGDLFKQKVLSYNHVLWTIKIEFISSVITYFIYKLVKGENKSIWRIILILCVIIIIPNENKLFYIAFFIGTIYGELYARKQHCNIKRNLKFDFKWLKILLLIFSLVFLSYPYVIYQGKYIYKYLESDIIKVAIMYINNIKVFGTVDFLNFIHFIGVVIFIYISIGSSIINKIFCKNIFQKLGKISYSIYLLHWILLLSVVPFILNLLKDKVSYYANLFIALSIFFIILILGSIILNRINDKITVLIRSKINYQKSKVKVS